MQASFFFVDTIFSNLFEYLCIFMYFCGKGGI